MSRRPALTALALAMAIPLVLAPPVAAGDLGSVDGAVLTDASLTATPTPLPTATPTVDATPLPTPTATPTVSGVPTPTDGTLRSTPVGTLVDGVSGTTDGILDGTTDDADALTGAVTGALSGDGTLDASSVLDLEASLANRAGTPTATRTPEQGSSANGVSGGVAPTAGGSGAGSDAGDGPVDPLVGGAVLGGTAVLAAVLGRGSLLGADAPGVGRSLAGAGQRVRSRSARTLADLGDRFRPLLGPFGYQRYDDSDPLEHDGRARLYAAVEARPGTHLSAVSEAADLPLSTARYHLRVLEHEGLVRTSKHAGRRRYYPPDVDAEALAAALADEAPAGVLRSLAEGGPASVSELAGRLDRDPSTVSHHLDRLADAGLVERERRGRAVVSRVDPDVEAAVVGEGPAERARPAANA